MSAFDYMSDEQYEEVFGATRAQTEAVEALRETYPDLNDPTWMERVAELVVEKDYVRRWDPAFIEQVYLDEKRRMAAGRTRRRWWHRLLGGRRA